MKKGRRQIGSRGRKEIRRKRMKRINSRKRFEESNKKKDNMRRR
jgi:hypothetical protein